MRNELLFWGKNPQNFPETFLTLNRGGVSCVAMKLLSDVTCVFPLFTIS